MNNENNTTVGSGVSGVSLLGIAFIVLKLCGVIKWSWLWVLSPFWISFAIGIIVFVAYILFVKWFFKREGK